MEELKNIIRDIPDFPKQGIQFKDLTTLFRDPTSFTRAVDLISHRYIDKKIDIVVGIEARGFVLGAALAYKLGAGIALVRKRGKLPWKTHAVSYELEYGTDELHIHQDAIELGQKVLISDDLLATGGTVAAVIKLVEKLGGDIIECAFLVELEFLKGREKISPYPIFSLIKC